MRRTLIIFTLLALALGCVSAATFTGKVVGTDGKPISEANVWLFLILDQQGGRKMPDTDAVPAELREGQTVAVVVKLHKGLSVTGTVTDDEGKPAVGVDFSFRSPFRADGARNGDDTRVDFTTDAHGNFAIADLPAGKGALMLQLNARQPAAWEQREPLAVELPAKAPITVILTHVALHIVHGRVLDTRKKPLAGVSATFSVTSKYGEQTLTTITGEDGSYQLTNIPVESELCLLSLQKAGYRRHFTGNGDAVMAACTATVHGKVCDRNGKPVPGTTVVSAEGGLSLRAVTDAAGDFTLSNQPEGELHLIAATSAGGGVATCTAATDGGAGAQPLPPAPSPAGKGEQAAREHDNGGNSPQSVLPLPSRGGGGGRG